MDSAVIIHYLCVNKNEKDMKTTIDNNQRVFLVQRLGFSTNDTFCNLKDIPNVIKETTEPNDSFIIFEYWNRRLKKCSKKFLNEMFANNNVDFKLK